MERILDKNEILLLKREKSAGNVFTIMILAFALFFNFCYFVLPVPPVRVYVPVVADIVICVLAFLIYYHFNGKYDKDIRNKKKILKESTIGRKHAEEGVEAGSGMLYIPILGDLFPKLWGQKMKKVMNYSFILDGIKYYVDKEVFDRYREGEKVRMAFGENSGLFLGFYPAAAGWRYGSTTAKSAIVDA